MFWLKRRRIVRNVDKALQEGVQVPRHIGIIMDGNGRWARRRGLPRKAGHVAGAQTFRKITRHCQKRGVEYLTVYAFSTENWKRPKEEVESIMKLLEDYLEEAISDFKDEDMILKFIGDINPLSDDIKTMIKTVEKNSAKKTGMTLNIAINYGGREEIEKAVREISWLVKNGKLSPDNINQDIISKHLYTANQPDPDLILRPSGEYRLSNFLMWQSTYSELIFMDVLWPDFTPADLDLALLEFAKRDRRFGGI